MWSVNSTYLVVCRLPKDVGPCRDRYERWYYDPERATCVPFEYGGCAGNMNRFKTFESCINFCASTSAADRTRPPSPTSSTTYGFFIFPLLARCCGLVREQKKQQPLLWVSLLLMRCRISSFASLLSLAFKCFLVQGHLVNRY